MSRYLLAELSIIMDYITYCQTLRPADWAQPISAGRTVKDIVAHLVGWEREVALAFADAWVTGHRPWFMTTDRYDDFNEKVYREFKNYSPTELLTEWQKWADQTTAAAKRIPRQRRAEFAWLVDEEPDGHFAHHLKQIKQAIAG